MKILHIVDEKIPPGYNKLEWGTCHVAFRDCYAHIPRFSFKRYNFRTKPVFFNPRKVGGL